VIDIIKVLDDSTLAYRCSILVCWHIDLSKVCWALSFHLKWRATCPLRNEQGETIVCQLFVCIVDIIMH
jgi:hypothetical protein